MILLPAAARGGAAPRTIADPRQRRRDRGARRRPLLADTLIDGVEIDGEVSELGRKWFDMQAPRLRIFTEDARPFLRRTDERYDAILVDAYRQPYIPFYLSTQRVLPARPRPPRRRAGA